MNKPITIVGRVGIDLYTQSHNTDLSKADAFNRFVGGSAGNIATQVSRLAGSAQMFTKIANDDWGKFILDYLIKNHINIVSKLPTCPLPARNSLAVCEIKPQSAVVYYRHDPADLRLSPQDIDAEAIKNSAGIIITGTALSGRPSREAVLLILYFAERYEVPVIFDLDYRPTGFSSDEEIFVYYDIVMRKANILIGTEEEFDKVLSYPKAKKLVNFKNYDELAEHFLSNTTHTVIIKQGANGSLAYLNQGKNSAIKKIATGVFPVEVVKNFGAGDAFAGTFSYYYLSGTPPADAIKHGSAAAAMVVNQPSCTEAMPKEDALVAFMDSNEYVAYKY